MLRYSVYRPSRVSGPYLMVPISTETEPENVVKHFWLGGGHGSYEFDIQSYSDLQRQSYFVGAIGREKPCTHIKETIPVSYVPVTGDAVSHAIWAHESHEGFIEGWTQHNCAYWFTYERARYGSNYWYGDVDMYFNCVCQWSRDDSELVVFKVGLDFGFTPLPAADVSLEEFIAFMRPQQEQIFADMKSYMSMHPRYANECLAFIEGIPYAHNYQRYNEWTGYSKIKNGFPYQFVYRDESALFEPYSDHLAFLRDGRHVRSAGLESQLCGQALSSTSFNSNSIANGLELFDLCIKLKHLDVMGAFKRTRRVGESLADLWLKYRYAYCTTRSDIEELGRFIDANGSGSPTVARAGDSSAEGTMHVKIMMRPKTNSLGRTVNALTEFGAAPNLYNLWDLVPFSFVVDWFVGIGDVLEDVTQYGRCAAYDIQSLTTSWKWEDYIERGHTRCHIVYYERRVSDRVPSYIPYFEQHSAKTGTIIKRFADTVALIGG